MEVTMRGRFKNNICPSCADKLLSGRKDMHTNLMEYISEKVLEGGGQTPTPPPPWSSPAHLTAYMHVVVWEGASPACSTAHLNTICKSESLDFNEPAINNRRTSVAFHRFGWPNKVTHINTNKIFTLTPHTTPYPPTPQVRGRSRGALLWF